MKELLDLKIQINGHHTFFLNKRIICYYSGRLRKMAKHGNGRSHGNGNKGSIIRIIDFPGGAEAFELASRFCYNHGGIPMSPSNICLLHSAAIFLEMNEEIAPCNLFAQAEAFLDGVFCWTWDEILRSLRSCEPFFAAANSSGLLQKLIACLIGKISANSDIPLSASTPPLQLSPSSSSSTDNSSFRCMSINTPEIMRRREWWFEDLTNLAPGIIEKMMKELGSYRSDNKNLIITRFLLHYLKSAKPRNHNGGYGGIADTAIHGVAITGRNLFSCRGLLWVLRMVSRLGIEKESREKLEWLIGSILDTATLDDLLVSGHDQGVYDVNLVLRLVRVFVGEEDGEISLQRMKKVGELVDKYLREISPDHSLKISKFLAMAESLPDSARDCYDGVYRALDIYLESHPNLPFEERTRLCRCLNYEKLTLEACKDLAKNPRIPPGVAVQALFSQQSKIQIRASTSDAAEPESPSSDVSSWGAASDHRLPERSSSSFNLQKMQTRVIELEKVCKEMRGQMSRMARESRYVASPTYYYGSRGLPKLC